MVRVKAFPENILLSGKAIFQKRKCFHVFGCISKYFSKNIFWCLEKKLEKKKEEAKPRKTRTYPEEHDAISRSVDRKRCFARDHAARSRVLSLSRSPFARPQFRKSFEVKIGTEMNFCGQCYYFTVN